VLNQDYDSLSDIWSAGVVMYILLCGHPPFKGSTETGTLRQVKAGACVGQQHSGRMPVRSSKYCRTQEKLATLGSVACGVLALLI
jgi:serine/threonine protein kinase